MSRHSLGIGIGLQIGGEQASAGGDDPESTFDAYVMQLLSVGDLWFLWPLDDEAEDFATNQGVADAGPYGWVYGVDAADTIAGGETIGFAVQDGDNPFHDPSLGVLVFESINSYGLGMPADPSIGPNQAHTVIGWMKPASDAQAVKFWRAKDATPVDGFEVGTNAHPAPLYGYAWSGGSYTGGEAANGTPIRGQWNMIAYTYDNAGTAKVFLNGVKIATLTGLVVGTRDENTKNAHGRIGNSFLGRLSMFSFHGEVVSEAGIAALYATAMG